MHPLWWASALVLLLNDHCLKGGGVLAPWLTGKLSDFAGLLMAPVVVAAALAPRSRLGFWLAHFAVGAVFTLLKLSPACAAAWCSLGGALGMTWRVVSDATDLLALPVLLLSLHVFGGLRSVALLPAWRRVLATAGAGVGLVGIVATSRLPPRTPVLTPQSVLVAVDDELQALDRNTGEPQRRLDCGLDWSDQHHVVDGLLFVGRSPGVQACDLARGATAWERELDGGYEVAHADWRSVIARSNTDVWSLSPRSGAVLWHIAVPSLRALAWQDRLLLQGFDGSFKAVSLDDGRALVVSAGLPSGVSQELFGTRRQVWRAPGLVPERESKPPDLVLLHEGMFCGQNRLTALMQPEQRALWSIPWCPWSETAVFDDTLLVTQSEHQSKLLITAREPRDGHVLWHTVVDH